MARDTVVLTTYLKYQGLVMVGKVTVLKILQVGSGGVCLGSLLFFLLTGNIKVWNGGQGNCIVDPASG